MIPVTALSSHWLRNKLVNYFDEKFNGLKIYWKAYGGWGEILRSPFFHGAVLLGAVLFPLWKVSSEPPVWIEFAKAIIPSMVAFSLGAVAIIFAINSGKFFEIIRKERRGYSYYVKLIASFTHFIIMQIVALFGAMFVAAYPYNVVSFVFFVVFLYAMLSAVAAVGVLVGLAFLRGRSG